MLAALIASLSPTFNLPWLHRLLCSAQQKAIVGPHKSLEITGFRAQLCHCCVVSERPFSFSSRHTKAHALHLILRSSDLILRKLTESRWSYLFSLFTSHFLISFLLSELSQPSGALFPNQQRVFFSSRTEPSVSHPRHVFICRSFLL